MLWSSSGRKWKLVRGAIHKPSLGVTESCNLPPEVAVWSPAAPPPLLRFNAVVQHLGILFPPSLLRRSPAGVPWMWLASFSRSSNWKDTSMIDWARRPEELLLKEAIHIQGTPAGERRNRDGGKGIPKGWTAALKRSEGAANRRPNHNFR